MEQGYSSGKPPASGKMDTGFDPATLALRQLRRRLPHWEQAGRTYFVTLRVKGTPLSPEERQFVMDACLLWHEKKWTVEALVVMPDHVHLLVRPLPLPGDALPTTRYYPLSEMLHSVKSFTAHLIAKLRGGGGHVWLPEHWDRIMRDNDEFMEKLRYTANNPVKAGLCRDFLEYPYFWDRGMHVPM